MTGTTRTDTNFLRTLEQLYQGVNAASAWVCIIPSSRYIMAQEAFYVNAKKTIKGFVFIQAVTLLLHTDLHE